METASIEGNIPRYLGGIDLKKSWGREIESISVIVAIRVNIEGYREILVTCPLYQVQFPCEGIKENKDSWSNFLRHLKKRGPKQDKGSGGKSESQVVPLPGYTHTEI